MDSPLLLFGFLSLFHIIGAAVMARAVRELWEGLQEGELGGCRPLFLVIWAAMFGGIPFLFGVQYARSEGGTILLLLGQALVWTISFLTSLLAYQTICAALEPLLTEAVLLMLFGGGFLLTGVTLMSVLTRADRLVGLLGGGIMSLVGAAILGFGIWRLLKSTR